MTTSLCSHLEDYLVMRRALGFKLERAGALLAQFVAFAEGNGAEAISVELALAWARLPKHAQPIWVARRLEVVRCFARHVAVVDPANEVIPTDLFAVRAQRRTPYLYAPEEITALMEAAGKLANPLKAATFETPDRPARLHRTSRRRGDAARPQRLRRRAGTAHRAQREVQQVPTDRSPSHRGRRALPLWPTA
jgi:hypothetical protein